MAVALEEKLAVGEEDAAKEEGAGEKSGAREGEEEEVKGGEEEEVCTLTGAAASPSVVEAEGGDAKERTARECGKESRGMEQGEREADEKVAYLKPAGPRATGAMREGREAGELPRDNTTVGSWDVE